LAIEITSCRFWIGDLGFAIGLFVVCPSGHIQDRLTAGLRTGNPQSAIGNSPDTFSYAAGTISFHSQEEWEEKRGNRKGEYRRKTMSMKLVTGLMVSLPLLSGAAGVYGKQGSRLVTAEMRRNALENVKRFDWAAAQQKAATDAAAPWVARSDEDLWKLVTSQELPRACYMAAGLLYEGKKDACPKCGQGIGYSGKMDFEGQTWKVACPNCGEMFPKNDFLAFYRTALDEHGFFRRERGDRSLLFNAEHPDPQDPLHRLYVDDGYGLVDEQGNKHHVIAYYNNWCQWAAIYQGVEALARAYVLTSEPRYAHKAAVLLDRIADVYPDMDYLPLGKLGFQHSHGGTLRGRIQGNIWEAPAGERLARCYDWIFDGLQGDEALVRFCTEQSRQYQLGDKGSLAAICAHIEEHLLLEILQSIKDGRIDGNTGMSHTCLATTAIALDRPGLTEEWLDWLFDPNYPVTDPTYPRQKDPVPWVMVEGLDRDGMGGECGGYGLIWSRGMINLAEILANYPAYTRHNMLKEYPKLRQCFFVEPRLNCLDAAMPNIGDTGATGTWGRLGDARFFARGYKLYKDPRLAALAWRYAEGDVEALRLDHDIFEKDPDALAREIAAVAKREPFRLTCDHLGRYGQAYVQTEKPENGRALWIHYGYGKGHSHHDCLTIGLYAKNVDMLPDHGYPEFTGMWPQRIAWTSNTTSHNTLLVNDQRSGYSPGGKLHLFAVAPPLRVMDVSSRTAYEGLQTYRRTVALIDVSDEDSYVIDLFRARGGRNHRLIYNGAAQTAQIHGLALIPQGKGTFAGPEVEFTQLVGQGETISNTNGFSYLYDVARSGPQVETPYTVDWKCEDLRGRIPAGAEPHLRLHALTPCDEVALASGDPPQNKSGNPRRLRYLIQSRLGDNLESQFVTVLEPYNRTPFIRAVRRLPVEHDADPNSVAAVAVELVNGATDLLISCEEPTPVTVEGGLTFHGQFGLARLVNGEVQALRMVGGTRLQVGEVRLTAQVGAYRGKVKAVDASDPANNRVFLEPPLPPEAALVGQTIHFQNDRPQDTSYEIKAIQGEAVSTGDITIIAGFQNPQDFTAGYTYLVNVGDEYVVPCVAGLDRGETGGSRGAGEQGSRGAGDMVTK